MFARSVSLHLKPSRVDDFTRIIEHKVIPIVRGLRGFRDLMVLVTAGSLEAIDLSFWDQKADAEAYDSGGFREVLKAVANVTDGTYRVETREVSHSTFHKIPAFVVA